MFRNNSWCLRRRCGFPLLSTCHASDNSSSSASLSRRSLKGLQRNPFAPFSMASTAVALSARADTTRMRTFGLRATNSSTHSMPSISGMVRSMVTTSGFVRRNNSTASRPLLAAPTTSNRSICCERSMRRRMMFESSTIMSFMALDSLVCTTGSLSCRRVVGALRLGRHGDGKAGKSAARRGDAHSAANLVHEVGDQIHSHAASRILRGIVDGGEPRLEQQGIDLFRVQAVRLLRRNEALFDRDLLDALGGEALAVVLHREFITA